VDLHGIEADRLYQSKLDKNRSTGRKQENFHENCAGFAICCEIRFFLFGAADYRNGRGPPESGQSNGCMMTKSSTVKVTPMTIADASRIYRATAVKGNGSVPKGSFGARAMEAAMRPASGKSKARTGKAK
jgi:hypothetical protein